MVVGPVLNSRSEVSDKELFVCNFGLSLLQAPSFILDELRMPFIPKERERFEL